jgi:glucose-1-phosphate thymidylyltransferase
MRTLGIILAGGKSSRLYPTTLGVTKQLLPIYDKPLIYYPLATLMLADIKDILIITSPSESDIFKKLLLNSDLGINLHFATQKEPRGIAEALSIANFVFGIDIINFDRTCLILGDNFFYGSGLTGELRNAINSDQAVLFGIKVKDPHRFGVMELGENNIIKSLEEKPIDPKSNLAATGIYFYPPKVYEYVDQVIPSPRGELEITDLNRIFLQNKELSAVVLRRGMTWFDTGTFDSMLEASHFVQTLQKQQDVLIGSPHEVAFNNGWIDAKTLAKFASTCNNDYGSYLKELVIESEQR